MKSSDIELEDDLLEKEKFKLLKIYGLKLAPRILYMEPTSVNINQSRLYTKKIDELETRYKERENDGTIRTKKLKASSFGDWQFHIEMINKKYFENRDQFDNEVTCNKKSDYSDECAMIERISIKKAIKLCHVDFSINMKYYLKNLDELKKDLKRDISNINLNDKLSVKELEDELFYNLMCELFGDSEADDAIKPENDGSIYEKTYVLKNFRIIFFDGNTMWATAERGDYYLIIFFVF